MLRDFLPRLSQQLFQKTEEIRCGGDHVIGKFGISARNFEFSQFLMRPRQHESDVGVDYITFRKRGLLKILKREAMLLLFKRCDASEEAKVAVAVSFTEIQLEEFIRSLETAGAQLRVNRRTNLGLVEFLRSLDGNLRSRCHDKKAFAKLLKIHFLPEPAGFTNPLKHIRALSEGDLEFGFQFRIARRAL